MQIEIIGGGPGGMYAARLFKIAHPTWSVTVHERQRPDATFGFGVGLNLSTLRSMKSADPDTYEDLVAAGHPLRTWKMRIGNRAVSGGDNSAIGIERATLLSVLSCHAEAAGVRIHWDTPAGLDDVRHADLVVGADGAGSGVRATLADEFGVTIDTGTLGFIWCGADLSLDSMLFEVVDTDEGVYVAHVMPYGPDRCTFQVDARLDTIHRVGFETANTSSSGNDEESLDHLSDVYAHLLDGARLRGNRSTWSTFGHVRCKRWSHDNVVLIGDAAHTAHYSVGSGTRMAMEDALALTQAVSVQSNVPAALHAYERERRPATDRLQDRAERSQEWWTTFPDRRRLPMPQLMVSYMTRTGAVSLSRLVDTDPQLLNDSLALLDGHQQWQADPHRITEQVWSASVWSGRRELTTRRLDGLPTNRIYEITASEATAVAKARAANPECLLVVTPAAEILESPPGIVAGARRFRRAGADVIKLHAGPTREQVLATLEQAEQLRLDEDVMVAVAGPQSENDLLAAGVLAGRVDLVELTREA